MKKTLLLVLAMAFVGNAQANYYLQGNVGAGDLIAKTEGETLKDRTTAVKLSFGKQAGQVRYVADIAKFGKIHDTHHYHSSALNAQFDGTDQIELTANAIGAGVFYDFGGAGKIVPYVGAKLSANRLKLTLQEQQSITYLSGAVENRTDQITASQNRFGYGVTAGAAYPFAQNWLADANVSYDDLGRLKWTHQDRTGVAKFRQAAINVGLRYQF